MLRVLLILFLVAGVAPRHAHADPVEALPAGVRPLRGWIGRVIDGARPLSPTLDSQLRQVARLRLIVYVDELTLPDAPYDGRLSLIGASRGYRFLRIELRHLSGAAAAAVLAHELQHVLEVAASGVSSRQEFDALYRRIGVDTTESGGRRYDTLAAIASGIAAMRELATAWRAAQER